LSGTRVGSVELPWSRRWDASNGGPSPWPAELADADGTPTVPRSRGRGWAGEHSSEVWWCGACGVRRPAPGAGHPRLGSRRHTGGRCAGAGRYTRRTDEPRLRPHLGTRPSGCRALGPDLARRVLRLSRLAGGHHRVAHNHSNDNSRSGVGIDVRVTAGPVGYRPKKQQMRWSPLGAHLLLQVRTRVLNNQLADDFHRWYPEFTHRRPTSAGRVSSPNLTHSPDGGA